MSQLACSILATWSIDLTSTRNQSLFYLHDQSVLSRRPKEVGLGVRHLEPLDTGTMRRENVKRFALIGIVDANLQEVNQNFVQ